MFGGEMSTGMKIGIVVGVVILLCCCLSILFAALGGFALFSSKSDEKDKKDTKKETSGGDNKDTTSTQPPESKLSPYEWQSLPRPQYSSPVARLTTDRKGLELLSGKYGDCTSGNGYIWNDQTSAIVCTDEQIKDSTHWCSKAKTLLDDLPAYKRKYWQKYSGNNPLVVSLNTDGKPQCLSDPEAPNSCAFVKCADGKFYQTLSTIPTDQNSWSYKTFHYLDAIKD
jgi:hypothetical protein